MRLSGKGFTLIELIVVIVILGILAAVAIPKYSDLSTAARTAAAQGLCGALASSAVLLYASNKGPTTGALIQSGTAFSATDFTTVANTYNPATGCTWAITPAGAAAATTCTTIPLNLCNGA